jgi:hypothetical protein
MSATLLEVPRPLFGEGHRVHPKGGGGVTLEELLENARRAVHVGGSAECPVCRGGMREEDGVARCSGCASTLV